MATLFCLKCIPVYGEDTNALIGLNSPALGVTVKKDFSIGSGGWTRDLKRTKN
ncbi:hypothetical protein [Parapedobacter tibetensis]|uniref:hypothetical protein n=1 Tax=Parapedobacter tibetensis TaxID=2972951 RepID=UPI00214D2C3A|nr:hypothetical protein [Parapedobacter tibetensis]